MERRLIVEHLNDKYLNLLTVFTVVDDHLRTLVEDRSFLAGGAIRSLLYDEPNGPEDYDIFFYDQESLNKFLEVFRPAWMFLPISLGCSESETAFSITLEDGTKYQIIKTIADLPEKAINEFDFNCNMGFYLPSNRYLYISPQMTLSLPLASGKRTLSFNRNCREFISLSRIMEFYNKGYEMSDDEFYEMCKTLGQTGRATRRMYTSPVVPQTTIPTTSVAWTTTSGTTATQPIADGIWNLPQGITRPVNSNGTINVRRELRDGYIDNLNRNLEHLNQQAALRNAGNRNVEHAVQQDAERMERYNMRRATPEWATVISNERITHEGL